jgi:hypothetical protein
MTHKLRKLSATFRYGALDKADNDLACLDIKKTYQDLGGVITPDTEIDFDTYCEKLLVLSSQYQPCLNRRN